MSRLKIKAWDRELLNQALDKFADLGIAERISEYEYITFSSSVGSAWGGCFKSEVWETEFLVRRFPSHIYITPILPSYMSIDIRYAQVCEPIAQELISLKEINGVIIKKATKGRMPRLVCKAERLVHEDHNGLISRFISLDVISEPLTNMIRMSAPDASTATLRINLLCDEHTGIILPHGLHTFLAAIGCAPLGVSLSPFSIKTYDP